MEAGGIVLLYHEAVGGKGPSSRGFRLRRFFKLALAPVLGKRTHAFPLYTVPRVPARRRGLKPIQPPRPGQTRHYIEGVSRPPRCEVRVRAALRAACRKPDFPLVPTAFRAASLSEAE